MAQVLIVDDDQDIRDAVRFLLEDAGHVVQEAADGERALQALRASEGRLVVLLDLVMPQMNGIDVLRAVVADPRLNERHAFLLLTADNNLLRQQSDPMLAQIMSQTSVQVVGKPFDVEQLLETIDRAAQSMA